jgi:hypothetical protein
MTAAVYRRDAPRRATPAPDPALDHVQRGWRFDQEQDQDQEQEFKIDHEHDYESICPTILDDAGFVSHGVILARHVHELCCLALATSADERRDGTSSPDRERTQVARSRRFFSLQV